MDWNDFIEAYENLSDAFGKRLNDAQARRWYLQLKTYDGQQVTEAMRFLETEGSTWPSLSRLVAVIRSHDGSGVSGVSCAACNGSGVVFGRRLHGRKQLPGELWHGKGPMECSCRQGRPHRYDPALPGNPGCVCGGRGWMPYPSREAIPEGREYLGPMLSGRVMASCPCKRPESPDEVQREVLTPELGLEHELDVVSRGWLA